MRYAHEKTVHQRNIQGTSEAQVIEVQSADDMTKEEFFKHMCNRHPYVGFITRGEHEADHRIWPDTAHWHRARVARKSGEQLPVARFAGRTTVDRSRPRTTT